MIDTKQNDLLTRDEVLDLLSISRSALYQLMESHGFPRPIKVLEQSNRWIRAEIDSWLGERPRANIKVRERPMTAAGKDRNIKRRASSPMS